MTRDPIVATQTQTPDSVRDDIRELMDGILALKKGDLEGFAHIIDQMTGHARAVDANSNLILDPNTLSKKAAQLFAPADKKLRKKAKSIIRKRFGAFMLDPGWYNHMGNANRAILRETAIRTEQDRLAVREEAARRRRDELAGDAAALADQLLDVDGLDDMPEASFLIDGVIAESAHGFLVGDPGVGKSAFAISMALAVASGRPWLGREVAAGAVLYLVGEGGAGIPKRVRAERAAWGGERPEISFLIRQLDLSDEMTIDELVELNATNDYALIVYDTLNRHAGDAEENSATAMGRIVRGIDRIASAGSRTTSLVLHHNGKGGDIRGSSALYASADTVLNLSGEPGLLELKASKQKDSEGGVVGHYRLKPTHDSIIVEGVAPGNGQPFGVQATRVEEALSHFVRVFGADGCTRPQFVEYLTDRMSVGRTAAHDYVGALISSGRLASNQQGRSTYLALVPERHTFPIESTTTK